jgi:hypothetical protein
MTILGIRFCTVKPADTANKLAEFLGPNGWQMDARDMGSGADEFAGAVFPAGADSWTEIWPSGEQMPETTMLHIVVDDADAYAEKAKANGVDVQGPMDMHGERVYVSQAPGDLPIAVLSKLPEG